MANETLIHDALRLPVHAISRHISAELAVLFPDQYALQTSDEDFDVVAYARAGHCALTPDASDHFQVTTAWNGSARQSETTIENAWLAITWREHTLRLLVVSWPQDFCTIRHNWILSETPDVAKSFFEAVAINSTEVRGEVLVFQSGGWMKSEELYQGIQGATFDNLILAGDLKQEIIQDFEQFFAAREAYARYGVPWKRGVLFTGSPGNGKTHTVKALVNRLCQPCLYVKSFKSSRATDQDNIRQVFHRARETAPCVLVLEDLDSLLNDGNRAFFLNELDGFAANEGIVTLATTNHPERLDPAILDRPSRFDRRYPFHLPGPAEREAYTTMWNGTLQPELRLTETGIGSVVVHTDGFSYAYLKELFLSSMMRWINASPDGVDDARAIGPGKMDTVMLEQARVLREQMGSMEEEMPRVEDDDEWPFPYPRPV